ncbi:hypothetical protein D0B54_08165 [Solimonas sp. K1W22B-7]|uniref:hypothetical protein n=1 Tax=Solimonas sp. K1W22B-7 TaxID=2303331 RepID=UPI000E333292|nr:hypothetical protein [Solimonas sp. K1W22B-7]AXQ28656.1 hypothetical protein D0B54_08165 [Solimonas sp. K1W22B-7]
MPAQVLIDNPYVTLWYHPETKIVHHQMHRFIVESVFREFLQAGTQAMKQHGACKWLSDDRKNPVLAQSLHDWARDHWFPQTRKAGWKYWAIVAPEEELGQWTMQRAVDEYRAMGITAKYFSDPDEALRWLQTVDAPSSLEA